jgi:hypothetical protein
MDIFSIDVTQQELICLRQALEIVTVSGKDAKFLAGLQIKLETELAQIEQMKQEDEVRKAQELQELIKYEQTKPSSKKNS